MTDLGSSRPQVDTTRPAYGGDPDPTAWTGWVVFASFMMIMVGSFQAIEGLVALFDDGWYHVTRNGLLVEADYTVWGWTHLAAISALVNLAFIEAYPIWAVLIITIDVLVIYALVVHGRELRSSSM
jgi:hypothetical protein